MQVSKGSAGGSILILFKKIVLQFINYRLTSEVGRIIGKSLEINDRNGFSFLVLKRYSAKQCEKGSISFE